MRDTLIAHTASREPRRRAFGVREAINSANAVVGPRVAYLSLVFDLGLSSVSLLRVVPATTACLVVVFVCEARPGRANRVQRPSRPRCLEPAPSWLSFPHHRLCSG